MEKEIKKDEQKLQEMIEKYYTNSFGERRISKKESFTLEILKILTLQENLTINDVNDVLDDVKNILNEYCFYCP